MKVKLLKKIRRDFQIASLNGMWYALSVRNKSLVFGRPELESLLMDIASSYYEYHSLVRDHYDNYRIRQRKKHYHIIQQQLNQ